MARVIVHVDLDAFYAAVEQVRLGLPIEQPLAVQQWEGLIAVNYAARAKGVTRFMAIQEAKQKCPELKLVHVEVIGGGSKREEGKVSLERYRQASANILPIFHRFSPLCEKASIDEAYLDLTAQVEALLNQGPEPETAPVYANPKTTSSGSVSMDTVQGRDDVIVLNGPLNPDNEYDRRLLAGATIVVQLREAVFSELGYTCSAGIAPNKLLAKLASAMNKPYKQTVVTPRAIPGLMQDFPMRKIRNLGGKMGKELCDTLGCETAGDVQKIPEAVLVEKLGDKMGPWVFRAVRGIHDEPVQTRQISKSMLAAKSYSQTNSMDDVRHWLRLLSMELAARIEYDVKLNKRRPKTFHLYYRGLDARRRLQDHSKSCPVPPHIQQLILHIHSGRTPKSPAKSSKLPHRAPLAASPQAESRKVGCGNAENATTEDGTAKGGRAENGQGETGRAENGTFNGGFDSGAARECWNWTGGDRRNGGNDVSGRSDVNGVHDVGSGDGKTCGFLEPEARRVNGLTDVNVSEPGRGLAGAIVARQEQANDQLERGLSKAVNSGRNFLGGDTEAGGVPSASPEELEREHLREAEVQDGTHGTGQTEHANTEQLEVGQIADIVRKGANPPSPRADTNEPAGGELEPGGVLGEWAEGGQSIAAGIGAALAAGDEAKPLAEALYLFGLSVFERAEHNMPSTRVAVAAGDFVDLPVKGAHSITNFFRAGGDRDPSERQPPEKVTGAEGGGLDGARHRGEETGNARQKRPGQKRKGSGIGRFFGQSAPKTDAAGPVADGSSDGVAFRPAGEPQGHGQGLSKGGELQGEAPVADAHVALPGRSISTAQEHPEEMGQAADRDEPVGSGLQWSEKGDSIAGTAGRRSPFDERLDAVTAAGRYTTEIDRTVETTSMSRQVEGLDSGETRLPLPPADTTGESEPARVGTSGLDRSGGGTDELERGAENPDGGELTCPELSDVDLRQQQRLMAEFERQKRLAGLVRKRDAEGGVKAGASLGKKGGGKRKGRPPETEDGQKRILSFLKP